MTHSLTTPAAPPPYQDPVNFQNRLDHAGAGREKLKAALRFEHFLAQRPREGIARFPDQMLDVLNERAGVEVSLDADRETGRFFDSKAYVLQKLVAEVDELYMRNIAKAVLFFELKGDALLQQAYRENNLPELPPIQSPPQFGKLQLGGVCSVCEGVAGGEVKPSSEEPLGNFAELRTAVESNAGFLVKGSSEATRTLRKVWQEFLSEHMVVTARDVKTRPM